MTTRKRWALLTSNVTHFSNRWFSGVKTADEAMAEGVDHCGPVKTIHKELCLAALEKFMKDCLGGSYLVMKIATRVPGDRPLFFIG